MPESIEQSNKKAKLEKLATNLENPQITPEKIQEEVLQFEQEITQSTAEVVEQGDTMLSSGLKSSQETDPKLADEGRGILKMFAEKAKGLAEKYSSKMKTFLIVPSIITATEGVAQRKIPSPKEQYEYTWNKDGQKSNYDVVGSPENTQISKLEDRYTKEELGRLRKECIQAFRENNEESKMTDEQIGERFDKVIKEYATDVTIKNEPPVKHMGPLEQKFYSLANRNPEDIEASYRDNVIYYDRKQQGNYGFLSFIAELSHHINQDRGLLKGLKYAKDVVGTKFDQPETYDKLGTVEFDAHAITERVLESYLTDEKIPDKPLGLLIQERTELVNDLIDISPDAKGWKMLAVNMNFANTAHPETIKANLKTIESELKRADILPARKRVVLIHFLQRTFILGKGDQGVRPLQETRDEIRACEEIKKRLDLKNK